MLNQCDTERSENGQQRKNLKSPAAKSSTVYLNVLQVYIVYFKS